MQMAGIDGAPDKIQVSIAPVCPAPTQWTSSQKNMVADSIDHHSDDQGVTMLAIEWERLNIGSKICRGIK